MPDEAAYPPAIPVPEGLEDETAAALVDFLYNLAHVVEGHYLGEILRHRARERERQLSLWEPNSIED